MRGKIVYNNETYEWNTEIEECYSQIGGEYNIYIKAILKKQIGIKKKLFGKTKPIYSYGSIILLSNDDGESKIDILREFDTYTIEMIENKIIEKLDKCYKNNIKQKEINDFVNRVENKIKE